MTISSSVGLAKIARLQNRLISASRAWALGSQIDYEKVRKFREEAINLIHTHYFNSIPVYRKLSVEENIACFTDIAEIKNKLMLSDGIFKSYSSSWLDECDYLSLNNWLSSIYHRRIQTDVREAKSIDDWLSCLSDGGVEVTFSSGTSGILSFAPADIGHWTLSRTANINYLSPLLTRREIGLPRRTKAAALLPPSVYARLFTARGLPDFDAFFLGFRQGRLGNQVLMQQLAPAFRRHYFLFDFNLPASALRISRRGPRNQEEYQAVNSFQNSVTMQSEHYLQLFLDHIKASTDERQKVFIFGAPHNFKQLIEAASLKRICLMPGSVLLFGGGWKSFDEKVVSREDLVRKLSDTFDVAPKYILEGYSMTEISVLMLRCEYGRFHIPPVLEPVIMDDALTPVESENADGIFGFLDPLSISRPGFIISGDYVHLVRGLCPCGLEGPGVTQIERARARDVKGCGGSMASIAA